MTAAGVCEAIVRVITKLGSRSNDPVELELAVRDESFVECRSIRKRVTAPVSRDRPERMTDGARFVRLPESSSDLSLQCPPNPRQVMIAVPDGMILQDELAGQRRL